MMAQPFLQFGTVALDPVPNCRVVHFQAALAEQFCDIAERERVPKVPAHGAQNQCGLRLPPLEDRRSDCLLHHLFRLPVAAGHSCNTTVLTAVAHAYLQRERRRPTSGAPLTFPAIRAIVQEIFTGLLFAQHPHYLKWIDELRTVQLRI